MFTYNERWTIQKDRHQFILVETYAGKDRLGSPKTQTRETYHGSLEQVANKIVNEDAGRCSDLKELVSLLRNNVDLLAEYLEQQEIREN